MQFVFSKQAQKQFLKLPAQEKKKLARKIQWLFCQEEPLQQCRVLQDKSLGEFRFRVGDYRVIFDVSNNTAFILLVGHRKDIYR